MIRNRSRPAFQRRAALCAVLLASVALPTTLLAQGPGELAIVSVHSGGVDFFAQVEYSRAFVTLSGGEVHIQKELEPGDALSIGVFDLEGAVLPDGRYSWELELVPDARTARELKLAATENRGEAPGAWQRLAGTITLQGGVVAVPELTEFGSARQASGLDARSGLASGVASSSFSRSSVAVDSDDSVGSHLGVEEEVAAAVAAAPPTMASGPGNFERSDAGALAMGQSLEARPGIESSLSGEDTPSPRSISPDGKNGRPTSRDEVR